MTHWKGWTNTNQQYPPNGACVIAQIRIKPRDKSRPVEYTYARATFNNGKFKCCNEVLPSVKRWKPDLAAGKL